LTLYFFDLYYIFGILEKNTNIIKIRWSLHPIKLTSAQISKSSGFSSYTKYSYANFNQLESYLQKFQSLGGIFTNSKVAPL